VGTALQPSRADPEERPPTRYARPPVAASLLSEQEASDEINANRNGPITVATPVVNWPGLELGRRDLQQGRRRNDPVVTSPLFHPERDLHEVQTERGTTTAEMLRASVLEIRGGSR